ncbi:Oidioi.mRNA.OKI2018_I69.chr1.g377.t1.cds [Oikopleura dioica]|uniref:Oidioi.mRNA.OKI2018_I69.chr1.g377.t1.cds n=1 Tax=Oikopleura dioica TaxID=34765 RepID=A0ABN7SPV2_OIKDI|nr:Oidioi.mRNA.OKI2018_I69.chr1.g377.t1.cds [Oikopleura dioica]
MELVIFLGAIIIQDRIEECSFVDTNLLLINDHTSVSGSIVTVSEIHDEVIICQGSTTKCESFDGDVSVAIAPTRLEHQHAPMCQYEGQAVVIAGSGTETVEALQFSGWQLEPSHPLGKLYWTEFEIPANFCGASCTSLDDGIIVAGGYSAADGFFKDVYLFREELWKKVGELNHKYGYASMINYGTYFLIFGGAYEDLVVERINWDGEKITSTEKINDHEGICHRPIIFQSDPDTCSTPCPDSFCYQF